MKQTERYVTKKELAQYLGVSTRWLNYRLADGCFPHYRHGLVLRFRVSEVDKWMSQFKSKS